MPESNPLDDQGSEAAPDLPSIEYSYQVYRNGLGAVDAISRRPDGATVPAWDDGDPITIAFKSWLENNPDFDIGYQEPAPQTIELSWEQLADRLRGSALWQRAFTAALQSIAANAAMTLLLNSLTATRSSQDLRFAFLTLRQILQSDPNLSDFAVRELDYLSASLVASGFNPAIVDL